MSTTMSTRTYALAGCAAALATALVASCTATADADPAPATTSATAATTATRPTEPRAVPAVPSELTLQPAAGPGDGSANAVINDCACLDYSQICDCRSGTCYGWTETSSKDGPYACYEGSTFLYNYYCTHYQQHVGC
jgi:hypothetical protein